MENDENWAKAENPEVEEGKEAFAEAQQAELLRQKLSHLAAAAVAYGVDRDWVNGRLVQLGAAPVTGQAQYKINVPITGNYGTTVTANSRTEALEKFAQYAERVAAAGQITDGHYCQGVYGVQLTGDAPSFFSGPQDPEPYNGTVPGLDALKAGIRRMLMDGVTEQGWGHSHAVGQAIDVMGLEPLPELVQKKVTVPVSGTAQLTVNVFEGADEAVQRAAVAAVARSKQIMVSPDEIGVAFEPRPDASGFKIVDDEF